MARRSRREPARAVRCELDSRLDSLHVTVSLSWFHVVLPAHCGRRVNDERRDKIGVVVGEANHLTLASLCRHRRQVLHDTGHRSERLNRLFMSGKPELGRYTCEARIGKEPVRTRSSLLNDRVLQQSVYEDHLGTREIEAAIVITIDDERSVVHDELEVE